MTQSWKKQFLNGKVTWIIDASIVENTLAENLPQIVKDLGHTAITHYSGNKQFNHNDVDVITENFMDEGNGPIIVYGCQMLAKAIRQQPWYPGTYPTQWASNKFDLLNATSYMSSIPPELLLNSDYVFVPIQRLLNNPKIYFKMFKHMSVFVKDDNAFKRFPATILHTGNMSDYLSFYKDMEHIDNNNLIMLSSVKCVESEHRFVIVDKKIVSHSTYMQDSKISIFREVPQKAIDFVNENIDKINIVDAAYVLDIAISNGKPKVLEINSFSCADLYACDIEAVVREVSYRATLDFMSDEW